MADEERPLPEAVFTGSELVRAQLVAELEPEVESLGRALDELAVERRRFDTTRAEKVAAMKRFDQLVSSSTRFFDGLYRLAEQPALAERIRPAVIRRRPKAEQKPADEEPAVASSAIAPPAAAGNAAVAAAPAS